MLILTISLLVTGVVVAVGSHRIVPPSIVIAPSSARGCQTTLLLLAILVAVSYFWLQS